MNGMLIDIQLSTFALNVIIGINYMDYGKTIILSMKHQRRVKNKHVLQSLSHFFDKTITWMRKSNLT